MLCSSSVISFFFSFFTPPYQKHTPGPIKQYICNFYINDGIIGVRPPPRAPAGAPETCFDAAQDVSLTEAAVSFFSAQGRHRHHADAEPMRRRYRSTRRGKDRERRTSRLKSSFLYSITLVSFFFCCFVREREREREDEKRIHSRLQNQNVAYNNMHSRKNAHTFPRVRAFCLRGVPTRTRRSLVSGGVARAASRGSRRRSVFLFLFAVILIYLLAHLYSPLSFSESNKTNASKKKKSSSSNGDASRPSHRAGPSRFERAEYILPRRTNNKNRRRTQTTTTTTTHSFFYLRLCVGEFAMKVPLRTTGWSMCLRKKKKKREGGGGSLRVYV